MSASASFVLGALPVPATELPVPLLFAFVQGGGNGGSSSSSSPFDYNLYVLCKWNTTLENSMVAGPFESKPLHNQELGLVRTDLFRNLVVPTAITSSGIDARRVVFALSSCEWISGVYVLPTSRLSFFIGPPTCAAAAAAAVVSAGAGASASAGAVVADGAIISAGKKSRRQLQQASYPLQPCFGLYNVIRIMPSELAVQYTPPGFKPENPVLYTVALQQPRQGVVFDNKIDGAIARLQEQLRLQRADSHLFPLGDGGGQPVFSKQLHVAALLFEHLDSCAPDVKETAEWQLNKHLHCMLLQQQAMRTITARLPEITKFHKYCAFLDNQMVLIDCTLPAAEAGEENCNDSEQQQRQLHNCWLDTGKLRDVVNKLGLRFPECLRSVNICLYGKEQVDDDGREVDECGNLVNPVDDFAADDAADAAAAASSEVQQAHIRVMNSSSGARRRRLSAPRKRRIINQAPS